MNPEPLPPTNCAQDNPFHPVQIAGLRRMSVAEKLEAMAQMHRFGLDLRKMGLRMRHPDWSEEKIDLEARRAALYART